MSKRSAPAAERNRDPILSVLREVIPPGTKVLELASGTGQHAIHFAANLPDVRWQPTDATSDALDSIEGWRSEARLPNLLTAQMLDAASDIWPVQAADVLFCANMIHIAPWSASVGLFRGAARLDCAMIILYGPFYVEGEPFAPSNAAFDASLRAQDPNWGVRRLDDVATLARQSGYGISRRILMPANNLTVIFQRPEEP